MSLRTALRRYASDVGRAFGHAPLECTITLALAVLYSAAIHNNEFGNEIPHFTVAAIITLGAAWSATLMFAVGRITTRTRWIINVAGALAAAVYLLTTPDMTINSEGPRAAMLTAASLCAILTAPALRIATTEQRSLHLRRVNGRIFLRTAGIYLYGLALFIGLGAAIGAVDNLFDLHIKSDIYGHVFVWIMVVLVPWVILGGLTDYVRPIDEVSEVNRVIYKLAGFLIPPLVAIYFVILYAYMIRIAVLRELPHNLISPMVIAAGLLSALALVVFDPDPTSANAGLKWLRYTPFAFLPVAPLGLWALFARTNAYGWTEFRIIRVLFVVILAALAVAACIQIFRMRRLELRVIPIAFGVGMLLMATGPLGAGPISRRNQEHRLAAAFKELGINATSPPRDTTTRTVTRAQLDKLEGAANYLRDNFGVDALKRVAPAAADANTGIAAYYHLSAPRRPVEAERDALLFARLPENARIATPEGDMYRITASTGHSGGTAQIAWTSADTAFFVLGADTAFAVITPAVLQSDATRGLNDRMDSKISAAGAAVPVITRRDGATAGYLTILDLELQNKNGRTTVTHVSGLITMKRRQP